MTNTDLTKNKNHESFEKQVPKVDCRFPNH